MNATVDTFQLTIRGVLKSVESRNETAESIVRAPISEPEPEPPVAAAEEPNPAVQVWELYIPKDDVQIECLECDLKSSLKEDYSRPLLDELRALLKERNPDIFNEQENVEPSDEVRRCR